MHDLASASVCRAMDRFVISRKVSVYQNHSLPIRTLFLPPVQCRLRLRRSITAGSVRRRLRLRRSISAGLACDTKNLTSPLSAS